MDKIEIERRAEKTAESEYERLFGKLFPQRSLMISEIITYKKRINFAYGCNNNSEAERYLNESLGYIRAFCTLNLITIKEYKELKAYLENK